MRTPGTESIADASTLTTGVRLLVHLKENNLTYLLGTLIAMQMGLLTKATEYGSGICG